MLIEHFGWFDAVIGCAVVAVVLVGFAGHEPERRP